MAIHAIDDTGTRYGPIALDLEAGQAGAFNSEHVLAYVLACEFTKEESERMSNGADETWWLSLATELDIEPLAYIRTEDGFVTSINEVARTTRGAKGEILHYVPFFNPGSNMRQASRLHLSNSGRGDVAVTIAGRDSRGAAAPEGMVTLTLPAGRACMLNARTLESGKPESGSGECTGKDFHFDGRLGDGVGKWSLFVIAEGSDVRVMSLLESPDGHMTNMSTTNRMPAGRPAPGKELDHLPDTTIVQLGRWGPRSGRVGEPFNVQPNGNSALWFRFRMLDRDSNYRIYVGSQPAVTFKNAERSIITASLTPKQSRRLLSTEGRIPIHLVDPMRGKQLLGHFHVRRR